jgi:hypothetical protein
MGCKKLKRQIFFQRCGVGHFILKGHHLGFCQKGLVLLDPKLLVMCERIGEALEIVYGVQYSFQHQ